MQTKIRTSTKVDTNNVPQSNFKDDATAVVKLGIRNNSVATRRLIDQKSKCIKMKNLTKAYHCERGYTNSYKMNQNTKLQKLSMTPLKFYQTPILRVSIASIISSTILSPSTCRLEILEFHALKPRMIRVYKLPIIMKVSLYSRVVGYVTVTKVENYKDK